MPMKRLRPYLDSLREHKIMVLERKLKLWLNDAPFNLGGLFASPRHMAERIVDDLEDAEILYYEKLHELDSQNDYGID